MRQLLLAAALILLSAFLCVQAAAQGVFTLETQTIRDRDNNPFSVLERVASRRSEVPSDLPSSLPSGGVRCFDIKLGSTSLLMLTTAGQKPRAYFDVDGDHRFSDEKADAGRDVTGGRLYGPVESASKANGDRTSVQFYAYAVVGTTGVERVSVFPATYKMASAGLKGIGYRVALIDADLDGAFGTVCERFTGNYTTAGCDCLAVDFDRNGRFDPVLEVCPLSEMIRVDGVCYKLEVSPDASRISLSPVAPQFKLGQLLTGCPDVQLLLYSPQLGLLPLGGGQGQWMLPKGTYTVMAEQLARTDERGGNWVLKAKGSFQRACAVDADGRCEEKLGTPLTVKADVSTSGEFASIQCSIFGRGGEEYEIAAERNGKKLDPPKVKIIDERGRTLDSGAFSYG